MPPINPELDEQNPHPAFVSFLLCSEPILKVVPPFFFFFKGNSNFDLSACQSHGGVVTCQCTL